MWVASAGSIMAQVEELGVAVNGTGYWICVRSGEMNTIGLGG